MLKGVFYILAVPGEYEREQLREREAGVRYPNDQERQDSPQHEDRDEHPPKEEELPEALGERAQHVRVHDGVIYARYYLEQAEPDYDYYYFKHSLRSSLYSSLYGFNFKEKLRFANQSAY